MGLGLGSAGVGFAEGLQQELAWRLKEDVDRERIAASQANTKLQQDHLAQERALADQQALTNVLIANLQKQPQIGSVEHLRTLGGRDAELALEQAGNVARALDVPPPPNTLEAVVARDPSQAPGVIDLRRQLTEAGTDPNLAEQRGTRADLNRAMTEAFGQLGPEAQARIAEQLARLEILARDKFPKPFEGLIGGVPDEVRSRLDQLEQFLQGPPEPQFSTTDGVGDPIGDLLKEFGLEDTPENRAFIRGGQ